jgi:hypothetical protein
MNECENELIHLSIYLQVKSEDANYDDQNFELSDPPPSLSSSGSPNVDGSNESQVVLLSTTSVSNADIHDKSTKRKRNQ